MTLQLTGIDRVDVGHLGELNAWRAILSEVRSYQGGRRGLLMIENIQLRLSVSLRVFAMRPIAESGMTLATTLPLIIASGKGPKSRESREAL